MLRRRINPPVYNKNRVHELPIPEIPSNVSNIQCIAQNDNNETEVSADLCIQNDSSTQQHDSNEPNAQYVDEPEISIEQYNEEANDSIVDDPLAISNISADEAKVCIQLIEPSQGAVDEIIDLLDEKEVVELDDMIMIMNSTGIPRPIQTTTDGLIKHENDAISGNIAFKQMVSKLKYV